MPRAILTLLRLVAAASVLVSPVAAHAQENLTLVVAMDGGTSQSRTCPDEALMTGIMLRVGLNIDAIGIRCRRINANGTLGREFADGSMMGGSGGTVTVSSCPAGAVVVGQGIQKSDMSPSQFTVLGFHCQSWSKSTRTTVGARMFVRVWKMWTLNPYVGDIPDDYCSSPGRPVRRVRTMAGIYVNAIGFTCLTP